MRVLHTITVLSIHLLHIGLFCIVSHFLSFLKLTVVGDRCTYFLKSRLEVLNLQHNAWELSDLTAFTFSTESVIYLNYSEVVWSGD